MLDVDIWSADRHKPTSSPRMQIDVYYVVAALLNTEGKLLPLVFSAYCTTDVGLMSLCDFY